MTDDAPPPLEWIRAALIARLRDAGPTPSVLMCREAALMIEQMQREIERRDRSIERLQHACTLAAKSFGEIALTLRMTRRNMLADACEIARDSLTTTIEETKP